MEIRVYSSAGNRLCLSGFGRFGRSAVSAIAIIGFPSNSSAVNPSHPYNEDMSAETIREMLHRQPFQPFQLRMSNGDKFDVRHPEFAMLLKSNLIVGFPGSDRFTICALLHIADVAPLQSA